MLPLPPYLVTWPTFLAPDAAFFYIQTSLLILALLIASLQYTTARPHVALKCATLAEVSTTASLRRQGLPSSTHNAAFFFPMRYSPHVKLSHVGFLVKTSFTRPKLISRHALICVFMQLARFPKMLDHHCSNRYLRRKISSSSIADA